MFGDDVQLMEKVFNSRHTFKSTGVSRLKARFFGALKRVFSFKSFGLCRIMVLIRKLVRRRTRSAFK